MRKLTSIALTLLLLLTPLSALAQDVPGTVKFPTATDTADSLIRATNSARSTLSGSLSSGATTITVVSTASFPSSGAAMIDNEIIFYTGKTSTILTGVTRGADSTTAASHASGAAVRGVITAAHHNTLAAAIVNTQGKLGTGVSVPSAGTFFKGTGAGSSGWGALLSADVTTALGFTPRNAAAATVNTFNTRSGAVTLLSGDVTDALGFTPRDAAATTVNTFNTRGGAVTLLSADVTSALGFTPRDAAAATVNTFNGRSGTVALSSTDVTDALTFTPRNATAATVNTFNTRSGAISLLSGDVTSALGFTPRDAAATTVNTFNGRSGSVGLILGDVTGALTFTPLNPANNLAEIASAPAARTILGIGSMGTQNANNVNITGGTATGLNCIACTGIGGSTAAPAATAPGDVIINADTDVNGAGRVAIRGGVTEGFGVEADGTPMISGQVVHKVFNAKTYGVVGDGTTNDATNLQAALTAASGAGALDVILPPGQYQMAGPITVPKNVRLVGFSAGTHPRPESGTWTPTRSVDYTKGTVIRCTGDSGNEGGTSCVTLGQNAVLENVTIYYPNQSPTAGTPTAYPWAISFDGMDARVENVELVNPYKGIYIGNFSHRATVRNVVGQPLKVGLEVDKNLDVTRLQSIHFVPNWSMVTGDSNGVGGTQTGPYLWQLANGTAFLIKRADSIQGSDLFSLGYDKGLRLDRSAGSEANADANGVTYGDFVNISMDVCNSCIDVADVGAEHGVSFTNVSLVPYTGTNPVGIRVRSTNAGKAMFTNVKTWGAASAAFSVDGSGFVSITNSQSAAAAGYTADLGGTGTVVLRNAAMASTTNHVRVGASVYKAFVSDVVVTSAGYSPSITNLGTVTQLVTNHTVWYAPTLAGAWVNYDATNWETAAYTLTGNGYVVEMKGYVKSGVAGSTIFTLPAGLCPSKVRRFVVYSTSSGVNIPASVQVNPDCTVQQTEGGTQILSLDIRYTLP